MLNKFKKLIVLLACIIIAATGYIAKVIYYKSAPLITKFTPIGKLIRADSITSIFPVGDKVFVILDSRSRESAGVVNYLRIDQNATSATQYSFESLVFDSKKYAVYGGITVANNGKFALATQDLTHGGYAALVFRPDNILENAFHYDGDGPTILQIYNGFYDADNFYFEVEYDSRDGGTLCKAPLSHTEPICYSHIMPTLYTGDFIVVNEKVFYSNEGRVIAQGLLDKSIHQIGRRFDETGRGIDPVNGMLAYYKDNIYIAVRVNNTSGNYMAVCHLPLNANHYANWRCSYDPDIKIGNTSNIASFKIDQSSGNIVVALSNYDTNSTQLYTLNVASLQNKYH